PSTTRNPCVSSSSLIRRTMAGSVSATSTSGSIAKPQFIAGGADLSSWMVSSPRAHDCEIDQLLGDPHCDDCRTRLVAAFDVRFEHAELHLDVLHEDEQLVLLRGREVMNLPGLGLAIVALF